MGISRKLGAFYLDKLVEVGLLRARYEPVGGIRKVGRTPKVYEPTDAEVYISIPAREHDLLADILIDALLTNDQDKGSRQAIFRVARHRGAEHGAAERELTRPGRLSAERALTLAAAILARYGFEPDRATPTLLRLRPTTWLVSAVVSLGHTAAQEVWTGCMSAESAGQAFRDSAGNLCPPS